MVSSECRVLTIQSVILDLRLDFGGEYRENVIICLITAQFLGVTIANNISRLCGLGMSRG